MADQNAKHKVETKRTRESNSNDHGNGKVESESLAQRIATGTGKRLHPIPVREHHTVLDIVKNLATELRGENMLSDALGYEAGFCDGWREAVLHQSKITACPTRLLEKFTDAHVNLVVNSYYPEKSEMLQKRPVQAHQPHPEVVPPKAQTCP